MFQSLNPKALAGGLAFALVLGAGAVAGAAIGDGPFVSDASGFDSARDLAEGADPTTPSTTPTSTPGDDVLPDDETRIDGDRIETREFVRLGDGQEQTYEAGPAGSVNVRLDATTLTIVGVSPSAGWTVVKSETETGEVQVRFVNGAATVRFDAEIEDGAVRIRVRQLGVAPAPGPAPTAPEGARVDNSGPGSANSGSGSSGSGGSGSDNSGSGSGSSGSGSDNSGSDNSSSGSGSSGSGSDSSGSGSGGSGDSGSDDGPDHD